MPTTPQKLADGSPVFVGEDRPCVGCGYNLKGLKSSGKCPECGRPISKRRRRAGSSDNLVHAPMDWLLRFKVGATLLIIAAAAFVVSQIFGLMSRSTEFDLLFGIVMASTLTWYSGVFLVTQPRPMLPSTVVEPRREWCRLRLASRITQIGWTVLIGLGVLIVKLQAGAAAATAVATAAANVAGVAPPPPVMPPAVLPWLTGLTALAAVAGIVPLCVYLSNVCFWAADSALAINFRACAFTVTVAAAAGVLLAVRLIFGAAFTGTLGVIVTWPILVAAWVFTCVAACHLLWCLWRLRGMASWAVVHHVTAESKDERMRERAERMMAEERARSGKA